MPKQSVAETPTDSVQHRTPAPYLPFRTFQSALESLEHGIPKKLDRTMWPSQSGLVQSQILMALRFLGLVDAEDTPTDLLHELVTKKDARANLLESLIIAAYPDIVDHDLTKMSPKMVDDEMDRYHVTGETKRKAVAFFLRAAKFAGMPMHPLLSSMVRNTGPRKRKPKGTAISKSSGGDEVVESLPQPQSSTHAKTVNLSNGAVLTMAIAGDPFTLPQEERNFVFKLVDEIQDWVAKHPPEIDEDDEVEDEGMKL